jgi:hypothetical protein
MGTNALDFFSGGVEETSVLLDLKIAYDGEPRSKATSVAAGSRAVGVAGAAVLR